MCLFDSLPLNCSLKNIILCVGGIILPVRGLNQIHRLDSSDKGILLCCSADLF